MSRVSPLQRFQVLLTAEQLDALKRIEQRTGASMGSQIRLAVDAWLAKNDTKAAPRRVVKTRRKA